MKEYLIPIITLAAGWFIGRKKNNADAQLSEVEGVEKATKIWRELAQDMKKEVDELRTLVEELKIENYKLQREINELKQRV
jgi:peptidoglycan hydrolase CwlO-like protein